MWRGWLTCAVVAVAGCGKAPGLAGLWLNESPISGGGTMLRAWDLREDGSWRRFASSGEWPVTLAEEGAWRVGGGRLTVRAADGTETAWRLRELTGTTLDVDDVTSLTGHRLFVRATRCPMPRSSEVWRRFTVSAPGAQRPNAAFDVTSGDAVAFAEGELVQEAPDGCGVLRTPVALTEPVDGLARLADGSTAFWLTEAGVLTGVLVAGEVSTRTPLGAGGVSVTAARGADGVLRVAWLEPGPGGGWSLVVSRPAAGWERTRTRLDLEPRAAALVASEDGRLWTVVSGAEPSGEEVTVVTTDEGVAVRVPEALSAPYVMRADGALFAVSRQAWVRVLGGEVVELSPATEGVLAAALGRDGTVYSLRRASVDSVRLEEWFREPAEPSAVASGRSTTLRFTSRPGWPVAVGESADGRLHVFGSDVVWLVRDLAARAGPLGTK